MKELAAVAFGGAFGSTLRWYVSVKVGDRFSSIPVPLGTAIVNIVGCLLIGIAFGVATSKDWLSAPARLFLTTGFLGGFTTFSTFGYETVTALKTNPGWALGLAMAQVVVGCAAAWLGLALAR